MIDKVIKSFELLQAWKNLDRENKKRTADYIDVIAEDANELVLIWMKILQEIEQYGDTNYQHTLDRHFHYHVGEQGPTDLTYGFEKVSDDFVPRIAVRDANAIVVARLDAFYHRISIVLGKREPEARDYLVDRLAKLLEARRITRQMLVQELDLRSLDHVEVRSLIDTMIQQAAEISVFAKEVRAESV